jgi:nicotinate-nucleotide--dimethylbenzimidazole phosphoribosyltransferase
VDDAGVARKKALIETALAKHALPDAQSAAGRAQHWLAAVGGYEIAAMTGAILEAGEQRLPIVVDGFIATAAALLAFEMNPESREVCIFAHESGEAGHRAVLDKMNVTPLLSLGMRLGEGSGAALALPLLKAAARLVCEMATFEDAGVSRSLKEEDNR